MYFIEYNSADKYYSCFTLIIHMSNHGDFVEKHSLESIPFFSESSWLITPKKVEPFTKYVPANLFYMFAQTNQQIALEFS